MDDLQGTQITFANFAKAITQMRGWDFGDGIGAVTHDYNAVSHTYADGKDYTVTLTSPQGNGVRSHASEDAPSPEPVGSSFG